MSSIKFNSTPPGLVVEAAWDETILDALLRSGAPVPFYCRAGICGQCKSVLLDGTVEDVGAAPQLLTAKEVRDGLVLLCRSRAVSDCEVRPLNEIAPGDIAPWPSRCVVASSTRVDPAWLHLKIEATAPHEFFRFRAGQYTRFESADPDLAAVSRIFLASRPGLRHVDVYLARNARSSAVEALLAPGADVSLATPIGSASLREGEAEPTVVIAEGSGIASALGMVEALAFTAAAPLATVLVRGQSSALLERLIVDAARRAGVDLAVRSSADDLATALEQKLVERRAASPTGKVRAYVKAGRDVIRVARTALLAHGVRPWDTHVDNVGD
jgi:ferredoxin/ferredoxin-NADP reductase